MNRVRAFARDVGGSLVRISPVAAPRWPLALQAGLAIALPIAVFTLVGQPLLGYQAATGAFVALHASHVPTLARARVLPLIGLGLFAAAALGVIGSANVTLTLLGLLLVSALAGAAFYGFSLGPPGPLFFVLVYGLSAHIAAALTGAQQLVYLAAVAAGIAFAYLLTVAPLVIPRVRHQRVRQLRELFPGPSFTGERGTMLVRTVLVAVIGIALGVVVDPERTYWIVGAGIAVIGVAASRRAALTRGIHRFVGTVAGAGLYLLLVLLPIAGLWLAALLGALQFLIEIVVVRNYALALLFITPLVLLLTGAATGAVGASVVDERIIDTLVGGLLGMASGFLHRPGAGRSRG